MSQYPWTLLGWLLLVILVIFMITAPIAFALALRARRRALRAMEARRQRTHEALRGFYQRRA